VPGLYIRRLLLAFDRLTFHEVADLFRDFKSFVEDPEGQKALDAIIEGKGKDVVESQCTSKGNGFTRRQADLYIAEQVELLQTNEHQADPPAKIEMAVKNILAAAGGDGTLAEAHFLDHLNRLRTRDFGGAAHSLTLGVDPQGTAKRAANAHTQPTQLERGSDNGGASVRSSTADEANKGVR
jgi:anaphase-promoting complex subunit 5